MEDLSKRLGVIKIQIDEYFNNPKIIGKLSVLNDLKEQTQSSRFWEKPDRAQEIIKTVSSLEAQIKPWQELADELLSLEELIELKDSSLKEELLEKVNQLEINFKTLKKELRYSEEFDANDAIMSIYAGAGGTDAQDWVQMLFRMYSRWVEKNNYKLKLVDQTVGDEAGLKSITFEIYGKNVYGKLKGESGVHRLVRLSPFNADNLRQTSFAKVEIIPKLLFNNQIEIDDKDLKVDVYRSGGHGGQSVNTTDSAVRITHIPTGISVAIQNERSQTQNKEVGLAILKSKLLALLLEQHVKKLSDIKGPSQSAEWGNQIRSYVLHPYKQVKDLRTAYMSTSPDKILDGDIDGLIDAYLDYAIKAKL